VYRERAQTKTRAEARMAARKARLAEVGERDDTAFFAAAAAAFFVPPAIILLWAWQSGYLQQLTTTY
jgi:hypothetical protein